MTPKTKKSTGKKLEGRNTLKGVQNFSDFVGDDSHKRLDEMIDQTIYITKIEPVTSDTYGAGYRIHFKDLPNARDTYTASIFGQYTVPQIERVYKLTNNGSRVSSDSPIKATIRKAGRSYRFE